MRLKLQTAVAWVLTLGGDLDWAFPIVLAVLFMLPQSPTAAAEQEVARNIQVNLTNDPFRFSVIDTHRGVTLLESDGPVVVESVRGHTPYRKKPYLRWTPGKVVKLASADRVITRSEQGGWTRCELGNAERKALLAFQYRFTAEGTLQLEFTELGALPETVDQHSRIRLGFRSDDSDSYFGMGMRFDRCNHRGAIVTNWCHEVGENLPLVAKEGTAEGRDTTYAPVPFFVNIKGYGLLLRSFHYSTFDFGASDKRRFVIENNTSELKLALFPGDRPLDIVSAYFRQTGRYRTPKPWVFGVWAAAAADWKTRTPGEKVNRSVLQKCRENGIPCSAIMAEDWYWSFFKFPPNDTWELNRDEYPNYERLIAEQHRQGVKHLSYFTPGFCPDLLFQKSKVFEEGKAAGVFTKDVKGNPALFDFFVWRNSQIDVTNPAARKWFANKFYERARNWGVDGWMNDFGEYTPYDSRSSNGELGWSMHNRYPLLWAKLARDFWDEKRPDGDWCVFARSGYFGQLSNLSFLFTGDRDATYEPLSGLGGQVTGILNASLSAHPNTSMDIGAYNAISAGPMGKLLMFRWIEMGALVPVMRLHRGFPTHDHWRFDSDAETLAHWKKYAILHTQLFPYIYTLAHQAQEEGLPMVRHLVLHYPQDQQAAKQDFEFLLGDRLLSAPIISEQIPRSRADMSMAKQTAKVYLPPGNWYHFWSNRPYRGGDYVEVPAAPGYLPMFVKEGTILPLFDTPVDTLAEGVEDPAIRDFEVANRSVEIRFYGYGKDQLTLWDGTTLQVSRARGQAGRCQVSEDKSRGYTAVFVD